MLSQRVLGGAILVAITLVSGAAVAARQSSSASLVGVWRVAEVTYTGPNARKLTNPQPSMRIFTQRHYSFNDVTSDTPRGELPQAPTQPTDKQLADAFGPFIGQAGTYEVRGNELTTRPVVAKNPNGMRGGVFNTFTFVLEGQTLTLTPKATQNGPIANPTTLKLAKIG
jgi:hypothetical protein